MPARTCAMLANFLCPFDSFCAFAEGAACPPTMQPEDHQPNLIGNHLTSRVATLTRVLKSGS
jgi:hypothetical protein